MASIVVTLEWEFSRLSGVLPRVYNATQVVDLPGHLEMRMRLTGAQPTEGESDGTSLQNQVRVGGVRTRVVS